MKKALLTLFIAISVTVLGGCSEITFQSDTSSEESTEEQNDLITVTLSLGGGQISDNYENPISLDKGDQLYELPSIKKEGYTFKGWYTHETRMNTEFDHNKPLTEDLILYARFDKDDAYEIALITYESTVNDGNYNQLAWEGVKAYAEEHNRTYKYYIPELLTKNGFLDSIATAIENGAKVIVTPSFLFEETIYEAQDLYPKITFILIDGTPHSAGYEYKTNDNVYTIFYSEVQAGFLAGYAAVKEGFTELGFIGGLEIPPIINYVQGFVQGADYAANEMGLADHSITVRYSYVCGFLPSDTIVSANHLYNLGTELIFTAAGGGDLSVVSEAEDFNGYVITPDVDGTTMSQTVMSSAIKEIGNSVYGALTEHYNGTSLVYKTGERTILDVTNNGVGLVLDRFHTFTEDEYEVIYSKLQDNQDSIRTNLVTDYTVEMIDLDTSKVIIEER
ncbi:BMP family ABC transporter substrate-binding protein [Haloplasma contractile]|uniref:Basic membrane protein family protein n=1 Tax=Haloplasma contractile SSD-17B TaxID=1033810 RepID=U2DY96_9MOLU|nr:BMP family ABC transporter substrate-binding protein [Haloplasma contractile]ERJ13232.1 Basic membrane protein family protein [Haloplasma contractile SSD-17B]